MGAKAPLAALLLCCLLAAVPAPRFSRWSGSGSGFHLLLGHRAEPGAAALAGALFALWGAARTPGGCAAQSTGVGTVKAAQKISSTQGGFSASGISLDNNDYFGISIASVGDVDGDTVSDICVGAYGDDDGGTNRGAVYMLFLSSNGTVKASQKISSAQGGLTASGVALDNRDIFGSSVASVGDFDGDTVADICVGAYGDGDGGRDRGTVYMLFLNSNGTVRASQKISSTQGGLNASGVSLEDEDFFGNSVASVGDFDGDTVTDICVGAYGDGDGGRDRGTVYMLFLNSNGTVRASQKISSTQGGLNASSVSLEDEDFFGTSVASVGDFDVDSVTDICVGAFGDDDGGTNRGAVYMLFLNSNGTVKASQKISSAQGGLTASGVTLENDDLFGISVAAVGDFDSTVTDICVGARRDDDGGTERGAVYVLFLNSNGTVKASQKISLTQGGLNASGVSLDDSDWFGISVASVGDFDSDTVTDICVGAYGDDDGGFDYGAVYMLFLSSGTATESPTTAGLSGTTTALATGTSTSMLTLTSSISLSSSAGASSAAGEVPSSGGSESANAVLIIIPVIVVLVFCVCAIVAVLVYFRVRYLRANGVAGREEVELDVAVDHGALDVSPSATADAGPYHNVQQQGASRGAGEAASSEGAYHNVSRGGRRQDGPASQAGAYHNVKHAREPRNEGGAYHNVGTATRQATEEGAYHNVTRAGKPRKEGAYHNVQRAVEEAENQDV